MLILIAVATCAYDKSIELLAYQASPLILPTHCVIDGRDISWNCRLEALAGNCATGAPQKEGLRGTQC